MEETGLEDILTIAILVVLPLVALLLGAQSASTSGRHVSSSDDAHAAHRMVRGSWSTMPPDVLPMPDSMLEWPDYQSLPGVWVMVWPGPGLSEVPGTDDVPLEQESPAERLN